MKLCLQDATEEYDPIHPPGTIEKTLPEGDYSVDVAYFT